MKPTTKRRGFLIIIILFLLFILLNFYKDNVKGFFYDFSSPIQKILWQKGRGISFFFQGLFEMKNLKEEAENLKLRNQELLAEIDRLKEMEKENQYLSEALNLQINKDFKLVMAQIVSKDTSQDSLLINKGQRDGISGGLTVISSSKALVGKIGSVYKNNSEVILISNKKSNISVKIGGEEINGIIKGQGNYKIIADLIPLDKEIKAGDQVLTIGRDENIPGNLLVGQVNKILKKDINPYQQAEILPFFDPGKTDSLFIITNY
jgi:rod shape-determining protein MreC